MTTIMSMLVKIGADTKELHDKMSESERMANGFAKALTSISNAAIVGGIAAVSVAVGALSVAMKTGLSEAMEWQDGIAQLDAGLKSTGSVAGVTKQQILDLADSMQAETRYSDDAILSASTLALTFTKISKDVFPDVIRLSADMATRMKMDLNSALMSVARAMQDPIAGAGMLRRQGVMLTDQQEAMIKTMVEAGDQMGAQKIILGELATEFGGAANAAGATFGGQLAIIGNQARDFAQLLGDPLIPVLQEVAAEMLAAFKDPAIKAALTGLGQDIATFARESIANVKALKDDFVKLAGFIKQNEDAITNLGIVLGSVLLAPKVGAGLLTIVTGIQAITAAIAGAGGLVGALQLFALSAAPILVLAAVIAGVAFAIKQTTEAISKNQEAIDKAGGRWAGSTWVPATGAGAGASPVAGIAATETASLQATLMASGRGFSLATDAAALTTTSAAAMAADTLVAGANVAAGALGAWADAQKTNAQTMAEIDYNQRASAGLLGIAGGRNFGAASYNTPRPAAAVFSMPSLNVGASPMGATPTGMDFNTLLAKAFGGNLGAAQGWQGAFQTAQGRSAGIVDIRDMMAGNAFAARTGRAATDEEWKARYYSGGFEGEDKTGLDAIFGPSGTLATKMDAQKAADDKNAADMIAAFKRETDKTLTVRITGTRITDPGGGSGGADAWGN